MAVEFDAASFYEKMKNAVVVVSVVLPEQEMESSSKKSVKKDKKRKGNTNSMNPQAMGNKTGGLLLDDIGTILTCSQNISDCHRGIYVAFHKAWEKSFPADLIARHEESDFALIRLRRVEGEKNELNYARVGLRAGVGMRAVMLSHPCGLLYSYSTGHVAFPCCTGTVGLQCVGLQVALVNCLLRFQSWTQDYRSYRFQVYVEVQGQQVHRYLIPRV